MPLNNKKTVFGIYTEKEFKEAYKSIRNTNTALTGYVRNSDKKQ